MSGCVAQLCFCALLQYLRPLRMLMCRLPLITVQSWRDWAASTESMIFSPHTLSHGPSQALQYVLESDRQTDSESHTWYTMVTDNGFYMKQLDSDFEIPPPQGCLYASPIPQLTCWVQCACTLMGIHPYTLCRGWWRLCSVDLWI